MIQDALARLLDGRDLSRSEAREAMGEIMSGEATAAQIGGFLVALRLKGETVDEIAGCAEAMREHVLPVETRAPTSSTLRAPAATERARSNLDCGRADRGGGGSRSRKARQSRGLVGVGLGGRSSSTEPTLDD